MIYKYIYDISLSALFPDSFCEEIRERFLWTVNIRHGLFKRGASLMGVLVCR